MARPTPGSQMSASEVVLGLVIERPGSGYHVAQRLSERLASSEFAEPTVQRALAGLRARGFVTHENHRYEPTPTGIEHFERWLTASTTMPPVREELHAKIALSRPHDLSRLIDVVRDAELASAGKLEELNRRIRLEQRNTRPQDWKARMSVVIEAGDIAWWEGRIKWLQNVRLYLVHERERWEAETDRERREREGS